MRDKQLAITNAGVRAYFPEILMGMYTDIEMSDVHGINMTVTEDADVVIHDVKQSN